MRTNRRSTKVGTLMGGIVLAALLAGFARSGAAQQTTTAAVQDTMPLTLLLVVFPDTTAAQNAMTNLSAGPTAAATGQPDKNAAPPNTVGNPAPVQWVEPYYAMVSKDKNGKVSAQKHGKKGDTARDTRASNSINGVVALLGERPHKRNESVSGAGATRAGISSANMKDMQKMLTPGKTALIIVVAHPDVADVTSELKQADATQVYDAPLVVVPAQ